MNDPRQNFNWCVEQSQIIHCKRSKIWETISSESNLEFFHPFCKKNNIITWAGDKSEDILVYLNGRTMTRKFVFWEKNFGYDLVINEIGFESDFNEVHLFYKDKNIDDEKIPKNFKSVIADELIKKITNKFNFFND